MPSVIDVVNTALDRLGQEPITSLDDETPESDLAKRLYPIIRDEVQRQFPWRRLKVRARLAADPVAPEFGFALRYRLPTGFLRLLTLESGGCRVRAYELEGDFILTDASDPLDIRYIATNNDPNKWDSLLVSVVATRLAYDMCEALTNSNTKKQVLAAELDELMLQARHANGREGHPEVVVADESFINVRWGGYGAPFTGRDLPAEETL
jgi:hypothetical protein